MAANSGESQEMLDEVLRRCGAIATGVTVYWVVPLERDGLPSVEAKRR